MRKHGREETVGGATSSGEARQGKMPRGNNMKCHKKGGRRHKEMGEYTTSKQGDAPQGNMGAARKWGEGDAMKRWVAPRIVGRRDRG